MLLLLLLGRSRQQRGAGGGLIMLYGARNSGVSTYCERAESYTKEGGIFYAPSRVEQ